MAGLAFLQPLLALQSNRALVDYSDHFREYARWYATLRSPLAPDALIVATWVGLNDIRYFQTAQGRRPDLATIQAPLPPESLRARLAAGQPTYFEDLPT